MKRVDLLVAVGAAALSLIAAPSARAEKPALEIVPEGGRPDVIERDPPRRRPDVPETHGFLAPLTKQTNTGRVGIAGFTVPNQSVGSRATSEPESSGWLGAGVVAEWGVSGRRARD